MPVEVNDATGEKAIALQYIMYVFHDMDKLSRTGEMAATRFKITQSEEAITAAGGIAMVGALLKDNRGLASVDKVTADRIKKGWILNRSIIKLVAGLFTLARNDFADIELFRDELAFQLALENEFHRKQPCAGVRI